MGEEIQSFKRLGENIVLYGHDVILGLFILVVGLIVARILAKYSKVLLQKMTTNKSVISTASTSIHLLLIVVVLTMASHYVGVPTLIIRRIFIAATLIVVGMTVLFRPIIPSLPYKVGNTIEVGGNLGKVEATTLINTRLKTFDGKTLFIPNRMILNDIVTNFHFTPSRRVTLNVSISYNDDIERAKSILKEILVEDPRVAEKPVPNAYVVNLGEDGVELSARGWVENIKYFRTRSDCLEKTKQRFDQAGITIPFPQRTLHVKEKLADGDSTKTAIQVTDDSKSLPTAENHVEGREPVVIGKVNLPDRG